MAPTMFTAVQYLPPSGENIMKCKQIVTLQLVLLTYVKHASSILCYDCNSAFDPRCGEEFDFFSLGIVNCSLRDTLRHMDEEVEATFCRATRMEIYGKVRVVRTCGYLPDKQINSTCRRVTGNGEVFVTYCECDTDLCNAAAHNHYEMALFSIVALMLFA